jgi:hypothetical protein
MPELPSSKKASPSAREVYVASVWIFPKTGLAPRPRRRLWISRPMPIVLDDAGRIFAQKLLLFLTSEFSPSDTFLYPYLSVAAALVLLFLPFP